MNTTTRALSLFAVTVATFLLFCAPLFVDAQTNVAAATDATCRIICAQAAQQKKPCPTATKITCGTNVGGPVTGICMPDGCKAETANGKGVDSGLGQLGQILGQLLGKLMQPSPPSPSSPSSGMPGSSQASSCTLTSTNVASDASSTTAMLNWTTANVTSASISPTIGTVSPNGSMQVIITAPTSYALSVTGPGGSGSCSTTVIPTVGGLTSPLTGVSPSSCDTLSQLLGTCTNTSSSSCPATTAVSCSDGFALTPQTGTDANGCQLPDQCVLSISANGGSGDTGGTVTPVITTATETPGTANLPGVGSPSLLAPGPNNGFGGDIFLSRNGATIFGNSQNLANNTGVAGFFGSDTFGGAQPQGLAAGLCQARPWASGFWGSILPVSFFDGLCTARGYQVGMPPAPAPTTPVVELQQTTPAAAPAPSPKPAATTTLTVTPQVQIWAVPASVSLDTRTSVFWNTQGVVSCTETSPDGSFNQNTLSGGSATVPLVAATTYSISCLDPNGNPVTGYVTVNLSI